MFSMKKLNTLVITTVMTITSDFLFLTLNYKISQIVILRPGSCNEQR